MAALCTKPTSHVLLNLSKLSETQGSHILEPLCKVRLSHIPLLPSHPPPFSLSHSHPHIPHCHSHPISASLSPLLLSHLSSYLYSSVNRASTSFALTTRHRPIFTWAPAARSMVLLLPALTLTLALFPAPAPNSNLTPTLILLLVPILQVWTGVAHLSPISLSSTRSTFSQSLHRPSCYRPCGSNRSVSPRNATSCREFIV